MRILLAIIMGAMSANAGEIEDASARIAVAIERQNQNIEWELRRIRFQQQEEIYRQQRIERQEKLDRYFEKILNPEEE